MTCINRYRELIREIHELKKIVFVNTAAQDAFLEIEILQNELTKMLIKASYKNGFVDGSLTTKPNDEDIF